MKAYIKYLFTFLLLIPIAEVTAILYGPFLATDRKWLSILGSICGLHFVFVCYVFVTTFVGIHYRRYHINSIVRSMSMRMSIKRLFFVVNVGDKERIVSGLFFETPKSVIAFRNSLNKIKVLNLIETLRSFIWIIIDILVCFVLRFFFL